MIVRISGSNNTGKLACGHRSHKGEDYYIYTFMGRMESRCKSCLPHNRISFTITADQIRRLGIGRTGSLYLKSEEKK